jgi:mRNA-degrading endonuclease toxin of MazEF toxin-antitoxin module
MNKAMLKRGVVVEYEKGGNLFYGVNIQNAIGNKFSPTIIIAEIEEVVVKGKNHFLLQKFDNSSLVVNLSKIFTIDKKRVKEMMSEFPPSDLKKLDTKINSLYSFPKEKKAAQLVAVNLGKDIVGSEQGGERPAIILQSFEDGGERSFLVAVMTSKTTKRPIPTHVTYEVGEGGLVQTSIGLFEQLKCVKEGEIIRYFDYTPIQKIPSLKNAFNTSLGLGM